MKKKIWFEKLAGTLSKITSSDNIVSGDDIDGASSKIEKIFRSLGEMSFRRSCTDNFNSFYGGSSHPQLSTEGSGKNIIIVTLHYNDVDGGLIYDSFILSYDILDIMINAFLEDPDELLQFYSSKDNSLLFTANMNINDSSNYKDGKFIMHLTKVKSFVEIFWATLY